MKGMKGTKGVKGEDVFYVLVLAALLLPDIFRSRILFHYSLTTEN